MAGFVGWPAGGLWQRFFSCPHGREPASQPHQRAFIHSLANSHCHGFASTFPNAFPFHTVAHGFPHPQSLVRRARGNDHFGRGHLSRPG